MAQLPYNEVIEEMVQDNSKEFGMKYKPRKAEPSIWQAPEDAKSDYKTAKINPNNQAYQKFKTKISKSNDPYTSESNDNYRRYHYDKVSGAMIPGMSKFIYQNLQEYEEQALQYLVSQKQLKSPPKQPQYISQDQKNIPSFIQSQEEQQQLNQKGSQYKTEHSYKNIENQEQLREELAKQTHKKIRQGVRPISQGGYYADQQEEPNLQDVQQMQDNQCVEQEQYYEEDDRKQSQSVKNLKKKQLGSRKSAKQLDPEYEKDRLKRREQRIKQMESTTRWLPNSAFQTYFGKPAFENYGMGNVQPPSGGMVYGNYMLSHNVNPHKGDKQPKNMQSFKNALDQAERLPDTQPEPPRKCKDEYKESQKQIEEQRTRNPLSPPKNDRSKNHLKIIKPDLLNSLRFASEENSPTDLQTLKSQKNNKSQKKVQFDKQSQPDQQDQQPKQQYQQLQPQQQYILSNTSGQENIEQQRPESQFLRELRIKKEKQNRIPLKVTQSVPDPVEVQRLNQQSKYYQKLEVDGKENKGYTTQEQEQLQNLEEYEVDPRSYKNIPPKWMQRIPYAGKKYQQEPAFNPFE